MINEALRYNTRLNYLLGSETRMRSIAVELELQTRVYNIRISKDVDFQGL